MVPVIELGFVIATDVVCPEQIVCVFANAVGSGLTVTTKFAGVPEQPPITGVMVYMITALLLVAFTGVSVIAPVPEALTPVSVPITFEVQLNVVPVIEDVGRKLSDTPLHISWIREVGEFVITGLGLTVTMAST